MDDDTRVSLSVNGGEEHDVTRLFQESPEDRLKRKAFYEGGDGIGADVRFSTVGTSGSVSLPEPIEGYSRVLVNILDRDGTLIKSCEGEVIVGFGKSEKDGVVFHERKHKVKLLDA